MGDDHAVKCRAILRMGDDHGDNSATFRCQLPEGHDGKKHIEEGKLYGEFPYVLTWEGDMRTACGRCGGLTEQTGFCRSCGKEICPCCRFEPVGRPPTWDDEHCTDCPAPGVRT